MEIVIIDRLLADAGVASLAGTRVTPGRRGRKGGVPAVVINRISGERLHADEGALDFVVSRLQVDCWGESYRSAKRLAHAVRRSLSDYSATVGTLIIHGTYLDAERDAQEAGSNKSEYLYRTSLDFRISHTEGD